jgi:LysM repeat protein
VVQKGEYLGAIASRYRVSVAAIKATNKLKGSHLSIGQSLLIPLAPGDAAKYAETETSSGGRASKFSGGTYRVRPGDNLFDIARRFGTTVSQLMAANHMKKGSLIRPGQRLRLGAPPAGDDEEDHRAPVSPRIARASARPEPDRGGSRGSGGKFATHTVAAGETVYSISRSLGVGQDELARWNGLAGNRIYAGQRLKYLPSKTANEPLATDMEDEPESRAAKAPRMIPVAEAGFAENGIEKEEAASADREEKQYYIVKAGDSLWDISVKYRSTVQKLKELNGKIPTILRPGTRIRVK